MLRTLKMFYRLLKKTPLSHVFDFIKYLIIFIVIGLYFGGNVNQSIILCILFYAIAFTRYFNFHKFYFEPGLFAAIVVNYYYNPLIALIFTWFAILAGCGNITILILGEVGEKKSYSLYPFYGIMIILSVITYIFKMLQLPISVSMLIISMSYSPIFYAMILVALHKKKENLHEMNKQVQKFLLINLIVTILMITLFGRMIDDFLATPSFSLIEFF